MTEREWLDCTHPREMLQFVRDRTSERRLRLFACALARRYWSELSVKGRIAVELAERFADGKITRRRRYDAQRAIPQQFGSGPRTADAIAADTLEKHAYAAACHATDESNLLYSQEPRWPWDIQRENAAQAALLRDITGNPFHAVVLPAGVLVWNNGTVTRLAQAIYEDSASDRLPILADALEEAGCTEAALSEHCRKPGSHVKGCWVIDLLLAKA